jgi:D-amino peptidase
VKIFIAVDREGVSGWFMSHPEDRQSERELMTADGNAAIEGAFNGGATEVFLSDAHGNQKNLLPSKIDSRAIYIGGQPRSLYLMGGIDSTFDAAMFVGYHAKAGSMYAISCHTNSSFVNSVTFNGIELGTLGLDAAIAGFYGVPVVLITGCQVTCDEGRKLLGDIETVVVKEGIGMYAAKCKPLDEAHRLIREGARNAMNRINAVTPFYISNPVQVELTFSTPACADAVCSSSLIERVDSQTIRFNADDYLQAWNLYDIIHRAAGSYFT